MANYSELLNAINAAIYENNDQEIDALEVRAILREMVASLGSGFLFKGIATPSSPGTTQAPDQNVFYLATTAGTYTYLGGLVVAAGEVAFLCYDGTWTKKSSALLSTGSIVDNTTTEDATKPLSAKQGKVLADAGAATAAEVTALGHKIDGLALGKFYGFIDDVADLPAGDDPGYAYVGASSPFAIYNFDGNSWSDSGAVYEPPVGNGEDIDTNANGQLQFANRPDTNGMGYKILRTDATFASQVTDSDTIYEIRYNFDLSNASVAIPSNCILKFNGGKLTNGTIVGDSTTIDADYKCFDGITFSSFSTFKNDECRLSWFCNIGDDAANILTMLGAIHLNIMYLDVQSVVLSHPVVLSDRTRNIYGIDVVAGSSFDATTTNMTTITPSANWDATGYDRNAFFIFTNSQLNGNIRYLYCNGDFKVGYALFFQKIHRGWISYNLFEKFYISAIKLYGTEMSEISYNLIQYCGQFINVNNKGINEENPFVGGDEAAQGNPESLLRIVNNYMIFANIGITGKTGTDWQVEKNCISHCSTYAIYMFDIQNVLNFVDNYMEGIGRSNAWVSSGGIEGSFSGTTMCSHLSNSHPGENGADVIGWGIPYKYGDTDKYRPFLRFFTTLGYNGVVNIKNNFFSGDSGVRSAIDGSYNNTDTLIGTDAIISVENTQTLISGNQIGSNWVSNRIPLWYAIFPYNTNNYEEFGFNIVVENVPKRYVGKKWMKPPMSGITGRGTYLNIPHINVLDSIDKDLLSNVGYAFITQDYSYVDRTFRTINEVCDGVEIVDGVPMYELPHAGKTQQNNLDSKRGILWRIPRNLIKDSFVIAIDTLTNHSSKENGFVCVTSIKGTTATALFSNPFRVFTFFTTRTTRYIGIDIDLVPSDADYIGIYIQKDDYVSYVSKPRIVTINSRFKDDNIILMGYGLFAEKPQSPNVVVGQKYFCTDKQTTEGGVNGIEIMFKGQDLTDPSNPVDVWVDALGRVVS